MKPDISHLSRTELLALITDAQNLIAQKEHAEKEALRVKIEAELSAAGFTAAEVLGIAGKPAKGKKGRKTTGEGIPPKYRNPANRLETWTGRGRKPVWVKEHLGRGGTLEECLIMHDAPRVAS